MKKTLLAVAAALLLAVPACYHAPYGHQGGPGGPNQQGCPCKCRQQPDCPKRPDGQQPPDCPKRHSSQQSPDCPQRPDCPKHQQAPPEK